MRNMAFALTAIAAIGLMISLARADDAKAKIGQPAPAFSLQDQDGKTVSSNDLKGKIVVLEWFNDGCPYVVRHYKEKTSTTLSDKYKDKDVVWLAVNSTAGKSREDNKKVAQKWDIGFSILSDADGAVGKAYAAKSTPHLFIIDKSGNLAYAGGMDNDPDGDKGAERVNYVDKALSELVEGKAVSEPQTKNYGCGVKYAK